MTIMGRIACPFCGPFDKLGALPTGEVNISIGLYDVIGRDDTGLFILDCPGQHHVLKLQWQSANEWITGIDSSKACFPKL